MKKFIILLAVVLGALGIFGTISPDTVTAAVIAFVVAYIGAAL